MKLDNIQFMDEIQVDIPALAPSFNNSNNYQYPKDYYWIFSACLDEWGNNHSICPADSSIRKGFSGHCICGCHK